MQTASPWRSTLPALIRSGLHDARAEALIERVNGIWTPTSSTRILERVQNVACGLRDRGINAGDRVALISPNRIDWIVADFGTLMAGCVVVPIFPTQALDQVQFILENSEAKAVFVDSKAAADRISTIPNVPPIILFEGTGPGTLHDLEERGAAVRAAHPELPVAYEEKIDPDDLAILIYTSGTTGMPKGVMLTHNNLSFVVESSFTYGFGVVDKGDPVLSVLPFSHIYEHMIIYGFVRAGVRYHICHSADELLTDLREVRPVAMTCVPRIFERMLAALTAKALTEGGPKAKLVPWALCVGREYMRAKTFRKRISPTLLVQFPIAHALVLKKIRPAMGLDRVRILVSGSAALHVDTAMTFLGAGIIIIEGYGPTECAPTITVNRLSDNKFGSVGKPIPGVHIKIAEDGEILAKGPNVMKGYYKDPVATAEVLQDGWYHTGDVGVIDADGYLRITDRKKELFKTSGGKFLAPARVESAIKRSVYINQVMLVGENRPHPAALISPNWDMLRVELHLGQNAPVEELAKRDDVCAFITKEVVEKTADLATFEQVRRVAILPRELTVENGDLSPTLKVKRRVVEQRFAADIERAYAADLHKRAARA